MPSAVCTLEYDDEGRLRQMQVLGEGVGRGDWTTTLSYQDGAINDARTIVSIDGVACRTDIWTFESDTIERADRSLDAPGCEGLPTLSNGWTYEADGFTFDSLLTCHGLSASSSVLERWSDLAGEPVQFTYDGPPRQGVRIQSAIRNGGVYATREFRYDDESRLILDEGDTDGPLRVYAYDNAGRLVTMTETYDDTAPQVYRYHYDANGNLLGYDIETDDGTLPGATYDYSCW